MKYIFLILIITFCTTLIAQKDKPMETVKHVDIKKYLGLWYEIAKIPNSFQKKCVKGTTAEYKLMENGRLEVTNSCIDEDGERYIADGVAKIVDQISNSKLEVSFFSILGIRPFWGDYWIIGLDPNYQYSVVGTPSRKYGWILARTPELSKEQLENIFNILKSQGYDTSKFEFSKQK